MNTIMSFPESIKIWGDPPDQTVTRMIEHTDHRTRSKWPEWRVAVLRHRTMLTNLRINRSQVFALPADRIALEEWLAHNGATAFDYGIAGDSHIGFSNPDLAFAFKMRF